MGALDQAKGKAKEAAGSVTGSDDLRQEGHAQQRKADEQEKAAEAQAEADKHEKKAQGHEGVERKHQGT